MSMTNNIHQLWQMTTPYELVECQFVLVERVNIPGSQCID